MMMRMLLPALACVLCAPTFAHADTIKLKNGRTIEAIRVTPEGDVIRVEVEYGALTIPRKDVAEIIAAPRAPEPTPELRDELARRKLEAGTDPARIEALAAWAGQAGMAQEAQDLLALARGIRLDTRLKELEPLRDAHAYVELARSMTDYPESERRAVLERALAIDPDDPLAHRALGHVIRAGRWVTAEEAARLDADEASAIARAREAALRREEADEELQRRIEAEQRERLRRLVELDPGCRTAVVIAAPPVTVCRPHRFIHRPACAPVACAPVPCAPVQFAPVPTCAPDPCSPVHHHHHVVHGGGSHHR
jgi:hypothetical protein